MAINVWLLTWNCENQFPTDEMLDQLIDSAFKTTVNGKRDWLPLNQLPHMLIVALQEAKPSKEERWRC